jgi:hypothetical protein
MADVEVQSGAFLDCVWLLKYSMRQYTASESRTNELPFASVFISPSIESNFTFSTTGTLIIPAREVQIHEPILLNGNCFFAQKF